MMKSRFIGWCLSPVLSVLFRWFLGVIFLYAGLIKASDPHGFAHSIYDYRLLLGWMINPMAILMPWVEILVGISLLLGILTQGAALVGSGLMAVFTGALGISLARGLAIACGCFSTSSTAEPATWLNLLENLVLLGMGVHVFLFDQGLFRVSRLIRK